MSKSADRLVHRAAGAVLAALLVAGSGGVALADRASNTAVLGIVLEPPHLDPTAGAAAAIDETVTVNVFQGLTFIDETGHVQPLLAESWTVSEDGKVWRFKLRPGVKFHDGAPFTAEDAKFSLDRARGPDSVNAQKALFEPIEDVKVVDPLTLEILLKRPTGGLAFNLGWGDAVILSKASAADAKAKPVGTGPFRFREWVKGDHITLERNPDYWGTPAELNGVVFKVIPDPNAALAALMSDAIDALPQFGAPEALDQIRADSRFKVVIGTTEGETILALNNAKKPFDDLRVRRAIAHAVDRKAVIDGATFGLAQPIGSHVSPQNPAYVDLTGAYPYDPAEAKKLLKEAGYPDGFKATLKLPPPAYARRGGEIIAAELAEIGIKAEIIPVEWAQWLDQVFKGHDFDMTIIAHTEPADIDIYARPTYYFGYHSPDFNAIIAELSASNDETKRIELLQKAQKKLSEDAVNTFLFELPKVGVWRADLVGLWENYPVPANDMSGVHWEK